MLMIAEGFVVMTTTTATIGDDVADDGHTYVDEDVAISAAVKDV